MIRNTLALVAALAGCRAHTESAARDDSEIGVCNELPTSRPDKAIVKLSRVEGQSLVRLYDVAFVGDAMCPISPYVPPSPDCVRLADDAMDYVWKGMRDASLDTIEHESHGQCIHCGGDSISIEWPGGSCYVGNDHTQNVVTSSWRRFAGAVQLLEAAAHAGGVEPKPGLMQKPPP